MKTGALILKFLLIIVSVGITSLLVAVFPPEKYRKLGFSDSITALKLRQIELGFSANQVAAILGHPIEVIPNAGGGLSYLYYSKKLKWPFWQPKIWVVCQDGNVIEVRVERMAYWGDDFDSEYYNKSKYGVRESRDFEDFFRQGPE